MVAVSAEPEALVDAVSAEPEASVVAVSAEPEVSVVAVSAEPEALVDAVSAEPEASVDAVSVASSGSSAGDCSGSAGAERGAAATIDCSGISWKDLESLAFELDGDTIRLSGGTASFNYGGASTDVYTLQDWAAAGDLDGDGDNDDVVAYVVLRSAGTGVFHFLIPVIDEDGVPAVGPAVWVGDRVVLESILVRDTRVEVTLLGRAVDEPYTVITTRETLEIDLSGPEPVVRSLRSEPIDDPEPVGAPAPDSQPELALEVVEPLGSDSGRSGGARQVEPVEPAWTPQPGRPGRAAGSGDAQSEAYAWHDGDRTLTVWLQTDLAVLQADAITKSTDIVASASFGQIVGINANSAQTGQPVFVSDGGTLMALPGGVVLILDPLWDIDHTGAFFAGNGISLDRVSELDFVANGFFVQTDAGFASLELANALAAQAGVEVSSPNWWRERTHR